MPGTTPRGFRYMVDSDPLGDVATHIQNTATDLDLKVGNSAAGSTTITAAANTITSKAIALPAGRFVATPVVVGQAGDARVSGVWVIPNSKDQATIYIRATAADTYTVWWLARSVG